MKLERKMVYEAVALSERFPDLSDFDVLEHINYVYRCDITTGTILGRAILIAYGTQNEHRGLDFYEKMKG